MKRNRLFALAVVVAGSMLVSPASFAGVNGKVAQAITVSAQDAPSPLKPTPTPPVCTFLFDKNGKVVQPAVVARGIANRGICRDRNGNKVWGTQFNYTNLTVTNLDYASDCTVKKTFGSTGSTGVIPITYKGVTVKYRITVWVPRTSTHLASNLKDLHSTMNFTVTIPGIGDTHTICPGNPPVVNTDPNSPTGTGNGGNANAGWFCGWGPPKQLTINSSGLITPPPPDCSGNGNCSWVVDGGHYTSGVYTVYTGSVVCSNGVMASPIITVTVTYPDKTTCRVGRFGDTYTVPIPSNFDWYGDVYIDMKIYTSTKGTVPGVYYAPELTLGPITGRGKQRLC